jgi:hypothetical protein
MFLRSVDFDIPEDGILHSLCSENLKSYKERVIELQILILKP